MRAWLSIPFVLGIAWASIASAGAAADEAAIVDATSSPPARP